MNLDVGPFPNVDVIAVGEALPFRDGSMDAVLLLALIEHLSDPQQVVAEVLRILRPGGTVYAECPFLFRYHGYYDDYQRYTRSGLRVLFSDFRETEVGIVIGPGAATLQIAPHLATLVGGGPDRPLSLALKALFTGLLSPLLLLDPWLCRRERAHELAGALSFLGSKPSEAEPSAPVR
jgi:SAM-dependent methyltransferase